MKFSSKGRVLCLELKSDREQLKKCRGVADAGKRGVPSLHVGLAGALLIFCFHRLKADDSSGSGEEETNENRLEERDSSPRPPPVSY